MPVEAGSRTMVSWRRASYVPEGSSEDSPRIEWALGMGERGRQAMAVAKKLGEITNMAVDCWVLPLAETAKKANTVTGGLNFLFTRGWHGAIKEVAPESSEIYLGGDSIGGCAAAISASTGKCAALCIVEALGPTNDHLGGNAFSRCVNLAGNLAAVTTFQNARLHEVGMPDIMGGVGSDLLTMRTKFLPALAFGVSKYVQDRTLHGLDKCDRLGVPAAVVVLNQDACFRGSAFQNNLDERGLGHMLVRVDGPHINMAGQTAETVLAVAGGFFHGVSTSHETPSAA